MKGIRLPIQPSVRGGLKMTTDDEYIRQIMMSALGDGDSDNPFQDVSLGIGHIYKLNIPTTRGQLRTRVELIFKQLERQKLARLIRVEWVRDVDATNPDEDSGDLRMKVWYVNLETDKVDFLTA